MHLASYFLFYIFSNFHLNSFYTSNAYNEFLKFKSSFSSSGVQYSMNGLRYTKSTRSHSLSFRKGLTYIFPKWKLHLTWIAPENKESLHSKYFPQEIKDHYFIVIKKWFTGKCLKLFGWSDYCTWVYAFPQSTLLCFQLSNNKPCPVIYGTTTESASIRTCYSPSKVGIFIDNR